MPGPLLWGPNNTANNLQNQELLANGQLIAWNGPKNYIGNSTFENQLTTGYSLGTIGTLTNGLPTGSPTFGSGASGNLSISIVTSGQIAGLASLSYASSAATTQGNMAATDPLPIDKEDQAAILNYSVAYNAAVNPGNANWSGTSSNSYAVAVWDVTNSVFLPVSKPFAFIQSSGVGKCVGSFQTGPTTASIRFIIYNANATSGAATVIFDDFVVGPSALGSSSAVVSWNGSQTSQAVTANVTDIAFTTIKDSSAAWNGTQYVVQVAGDYAVAGNIVSSSNSSGFQLYVNGSVYPISGTSIFSAVAAGNPTGGAMVVTGRKPGDTISLRATATSTVTVGNLGIFQLGGGSVGPAGQVVASKLTTLSSTTVTANTAITFTTTEFDLTGSISSLNKFTCPISGVYAVNMFIDTSSSGNAGMYVAKNASFSATASNKFSVITTSQGATGFVLLNCNAGDTLQLAANTSITSSTTGSVSFYLLQGPSSQQATPSVNARYHGSSTTISSSLATIVWSTKDFDTTASMNASTGVYTVPVTGKYQVNCAIITAGTFSLNNNIDLQIQKNGTAWTEQTMFAFASATDISVTVGDIIQCNAGDTIQVQLSSTAVAPSISASNTKNWFSIALVGQ